MVVKIEGYRSIVPNAVYVPEGVDIQKDEGSVPILLIERYKEPNEFDALELLLRKAAQITINETYKEKDPESRGESTIEYLLERLPSISNAIKRGNFKEVRDLWDDLRKDIGWDEDDYDTNVEMTNDVRVTVQYGLIPVYRIKGLIARGKMRGEHDYGLFAEYDREEHGFERLFSFEIGVNKGELIDRSIVDECMKNKEFQEGVFEIDAERYNPRVVSSIVDTVYRLKAGEISQLIDTSQLAVANKVLSILIARYQTQQMDRIHRAQEKGEIELLRTVGSIKAVPLETVCYN